MANYNAIAAVSRGIKKYLEDARSEGPSPTADIALYQPSDFERPMTGEGVSIYLFNLLVQETRRNQQLRHLADGTVVRPPVVVDLQYLITPWAKKTETQQSLLGWVLRTLGDLGEMPATLLNAMEQKPVFRDDEAVELVWVPMPMDQVVHIWEVLHQNIRTSACYLARYVALDSALPVAEGEPVQTRVSQFVGVSHDR